MASSCHIGVIDNDRNRYRMWAYKRILDTYGVNGSSKIIAFSHINAISQYWLY